MNFYKLCIMITCGALLSSLHAGTEVKNGITRIVGQQYEVYVTGDRFCTRTIQDTTDASIRCYALPNREPVNAGTFYELMGRFGE